MMGCFFVVSALMVLRCFGVVTRGMRMVLRRLLMVLGCFFGHWLFPLFFSTGSKHGTPAFAMRSFMTSIVFAIS
jgi:hypothetical protein